MVQKEEASAVCILMRTMLMIAFQMNWSLGLIRMIQWYFFSLGAENTVMKDGTIVPNNR